MVSSEARDISVDKKKKNLIIDFYSTGQWEFLKGFSAWDSMTRFAI